MPIHFAIGFVIESNPKRGFVAECAKYTGEVQVSARYVNMCYINAVWPREDNCK